MSWCALPSGRAGRRACTPCGSSCSSPKGWTHPTKAFLAAWYTRLGYRVVHTGRLDDDYPDLALMLATPCHLLAYEKTLARREG